jgi:hypothetical protein
MEIEKANNILFKFDNTSGTQKIIFVYTPPKVGSTTLVSSLRISLLHLNNNYHILHIHDETMLKVLSGIQNISISQIIEYNKNLGHEVYVIDIYRTPIELKISQFFEKLSAYHFNNSEENLNTYSLERIEQRFNCLFPYLAFESTNTPKPEVFDHEKHYGLICDKNLKYIKLRLCDSHIWSKILSDIFGKPIAILEEYKTENKKIGPLFKKFKENYKLPSNYLEMVENDNLLNYYYTSREKENYLQQWKTKISEPFEPFTQYGFRLYMAISLENSHYDIIQTEHYFDEGCTCKLCKSKRKKIFYKLYQTKYILSIEDKIIHKECVEINMRKAAELLKKKYKNSNNIVNKNSNSKNSKNSNNIIEMKINGSNNNPGREKFTKMILF